MEELQNFLYDSTTVEKLKEKKDGKSSRRHQVTAQYLTLPEKKRYGEDKLECAF